MNYKNVVINGLKMPLPARSSIKDVIQKFFDLRCEFLVSINSKAIPVHKFETIRIKENDNLQVVTYSKYCYKLHKRTIFKKETLEKEKEGEK